MCIYGGRSDLELTDEYIVPYSWTGKPVLKGASCRDCEDVTKRFEQKVARDLWGDAPSYSGQLKITAPGPAMCFCG